jgi:hypothetical protein
MNVDKWVIGVLGVMALWWLGWETRGWHEAQKPKPLNVRPAPIQLTRACVTVRCPVSSLGLQEAARAYRAQCRSESISRGEIK